MSRTDLDHATLAASLRRMAGDGGIEWVYEPIQARVLLDIADLLDENAKLRELVRDMYKAFMHGNCYRWCEFKEPCNFIEDGRCQWYDRIHELKVEVD